MTTFTPIVEGDLTGTAFGASPSWTPYTSYVLDDVGVEIAWGRQDEDGQVTPTVFSFLLDNRDGRFTTGASIVEFGARFRVCLTVNGTTYDRCTGYVQSAETTWRGGVHGFAVLKVTCVDVSGVLGDSQPLRSMYDYETLADADLLGYWPLDEAPGSTSFGSLVAGIDAATRKDSKYGRGTISFQDPETAPFDGVGVSFSSNDVNSAAASAAGAAARMSTIEVPNLLPSSGAWSVECWAKAPTEVPPTSLTYQIIWAVAGEANQGLTPESDAYIWCRWQSTGLRATVVNNGLTLTASLTASTGVASVDGCLHHIVVTMSSDGRTLTLYLDGAEVASTTVASTLAPYQTNYPLQLGGYIGTGLIGSEVLSFGPLGGGVAAFAQYDTTMSAAEVLTRYQLGTGTFTETSNARYSRLLGYAGLTTSGLPTGQATLGGQRTRDVPVSEALKKVADTEGTVSFVKPNGDPTFQARNHRYWPTSSFTLTASEIKADITVRKDRLGLVNDQSATRDAGALQRAEDTTSINDYGRRDGGTLEVASSTDFDALQNAAWRVAVGAEPQRRVSAITVDLLAQTNTALVQSLMNATVGTAFTLSGMPAQTPGGTSQALFIEGGSERIALEDWVIQFFTSPLSGSGVSFTSGTSSPALPNTLRASAAADERTKLDAGLKIPF